MDRVVSARAECVAMRRHLEATAKHLGDISNRYASRGHASSALLYYDVAKKVLEAASELEQRGVE